jgi:hypothetical protein
MKSGNLQEEFAPYRGSCAAGVVARVLCRVRRDIEGLLAQSFNNGIN